MLSFPPVPVLEEGVTVCDPPCTCQASCMFPLSSAILAEYLTEQQLGLLRCISPVKPWCTKHSSSLNAAADDCLAHVLMAPLHISYQHNVPLLPAYYR